MTTSNSSIVRDEIIFFLSGLWAVAKHIGVTYGPANWRIPFFDLDEVIEQQEHKSITEIFTELKWRKHFRQKETDTLKTFSREKNYLNCLWRRRLF